MRTRHGSTIVAGAFLTILVGPAATAGAATAGAATTGAATTGDASTRRTGHYRVIDLGTIAGRSSVATAINDQGVVVGDSDSADGSSLAVAWHYGVPRTLGTLPGGR